MSLERFSPEVFHEDYERLYAHRLKQVFSYYALHGVDARLIGSVGVYAALGKSIQGFKSEYGGLRDIDILIINRDANAEAITNQANSMMLPISLDEHYQNQLQVTSQAAQIRYKDLSREVDTEVFAVKMGMVADVQVPTFDPRTLFHLPLLHGFLRPKDLQNARQLVRDMKYYESPLKEEMFRPFHDISRERSKRYPLEQVMGNLRWCYHTKVPVPVRSTLSGFTEPIWHKINKA